MRRTHKHIAAGFTLIEVLVVVAIIAILIAIAIPVMGKFKASARRATDLALLQSIEVGLASYKNDHRTYPESFFTNNYGYALSTPSQAGRWFGAQVLVEAMVGYLSADPGYTDPPYTEPPPPNAWFNKYPDGTEGRGFRTSYRGKVFGPYVADENAKTMDVPSPAPDQSQLRPVFVDSAGNPVLYYKYDRAASQFHYDHNYDATDPANPVNGPDQTHWIPYVHSGAGIDFVLCSKGPDGAWKQWDSAAPDFGNRNDDITNLNWSNR